MLGWKRLQTAQITRISRQSWPQLMRETFSTWKFDQWCVRFCKNAVACQLLKGQQFVVCFDPRRSAFAAELPLTCRALILLLAWGRSRGAVEVFFLNSYHHIVGIVGAAILWNWLRWTSASGWGSFWERYSIGSWFSLIGFLDALERIPSEPELVGSEGTRKVGRERFKCESPSC